MPGCFCASRPRLAVVDCRAGSAYPRVGSVLNLVFGCLPVNMPARSPPLPMSNKLCALQLRNDRLSGGDEFIGIRT